VDIADLSMCLHFNKMSCFIHSATMTTSRKGQKKTYEWEKGLQSPHKPLVIIHSSV